jgi:cell division septum initiation protein DivIVA
MPSNIDELLELLYTEIEEAKSPAFNGDKAVIDRDRVLDMIDDVKAEIPVEVKRAQDLVANRNDYIASAKREADEIRDKAKDYAKEMLDKETVVQEAQERADEIIAEAEEKSRVLQRAANEYCEDTLRRLEEAVTDVYEEVKRAHAQFRSALSNLEPEKKQEPRPQPNRRPMYDAELDQD